MCRCEDRGYDQGAIALLSDGHLTTEDVGCEERITGLGFQLNCPQANIAALIPIPRTHNSATDVVACRSVATGLMFRSLISLAFGLAARFSWRRMSR